MRFVFAGLFLIVSISAAATEEVGRAEFNGRTIILNSDNSWQYAENFVPADADCSAIASHAVPVELCLNEKSWKPEDLGVSFEKAFASRSGLYLGIISEEEIFDRPAMKLAVSDNAEAGAGPKGLQDLKQEFRRINGADWLHSTFSFEIEGLLIDMENFMYSRQGDGTIQIAIWGGAESMRKARPEIDRIVATVRTVN